MAADLEQADAKDNFRVGYSTQPDVFVDFAESVVGGDKLSR